MSEEVTCVYFQVSEGKLPSDVGRNMQRIETILAPAAGLDKPTLMTDPKDSSVYVVAFPGKPDAKTTLKVARELNTLMDEDRKPLIEAAWTGTVSPQNLSLNGFGAKLRLKPR